MRFFSSLYCCYWHEPSSLSPCLSPSGNIINQFINKQLVGLISEMHIYTNLPSTNGASPQIWNVPQVRPGATGPAGMSGQPASGTPNWGDSPSLFSWRGKKKNHAYYGSWWMLTHTHLHQHTGVQTQKPSHKHTVSASIDQGQFMSLWQSSNHNSHTGHTRHSRTHTFCKNIQNCTNTADAHEKIPSHGFKGPIQSQSSVVFNLELDG